MQKYLHIIPRTLSVPQNNIRYTKNIDQMSSGSRNPLVEFLSEHPVEKNPIKGYTTTLSLTVRVSRLVMKSEKLSKILERERE